MTSMENQNETVILEVEGTAIECNKALLVNNSDYFRVMLTGNFKESTQETIQIQDVSLKSFNSILVLLWDDRYIIEDKELHLILQTACMLQFDSIKQLCETRIMEILNPSICMVIWKTTELLGISPQWLKAKSMALEEFTTICDGQILDLSLDDLCKYLGNLYLNVKHEFAVFQAAMNWWYENQEHFNEQRDNVILRLLNCIDFKKIHDNEIKEMQTYPDIANNAEIKSILDCLVALKANVNIEEFPERQLNFAKHFLNCQSRKKPVLPCFLWPGKPLNANSRKQTNVVVTDKYLRKRQHKVLDHAPESFSISAYDTVLKDFKTLFQIDVDKIKNLEGFKLISYKEFVFLCGGIYGLAGKNWNFNFWAYDIFKGKWERKTKLPQERRHFQSTIVDNCIYLIGGIGRFRVVQQNMVWYDFIADKWSSIIPLPFKASIHRSFKSCALNDKLCIIDLAVQYAYLYDKETTTWTQIDIQVDKETIVGQFALFSDGNYLYVKGNYFIRLKLENNKLVPTIQFKMKIIYTELELINTVLCNDTVYSLYKDFDEHLYFEYTFESFNWKTRAVKYIFQDKWENEPSLVPSYVLFSVNHYSLVKDNICINNENIF